jgi:hypothetical protein
MTYEALAQARGTSRRAAVVLVRRHKWRRQQNNDGHTIALVPATWATAQTDKVDAPHSDANDAGHAVAVFERALEALREAHAGERAALQAALEHTRSPQRPASGSQNFSGPR